MTPEILPFWDQIREGVRRPAAEGRTVGRVRGRRSVALRPDRARPRGRRHPTDALTPELTDRLIGEQEQALH